jgi:dCMP deaminase
LVLVGPFLAFTGNQMRKNWFRYFMDVAYQVSSRATCNRKHVGAVIVSKDRHIIATGYNGSVLGTPHCDDEGHLMEEGHCIRAVHAECNAIAQAAKNGVRVEGAILYCTALPCWQCFKLICNAGLKCIIYDEPYRAEEHLNRLYAHAAAAGVGVYRLDEHDALVIDHQETKWKSFFPPKPGDLY